MTKSNASDGAIKLRAWWAQKQGLDGSLEGATAAQVLERAGWARSVGGVGPYLTLFSRAGVSRAQADQAVANLEIHELPAARGCTYVVPAREFALALQCGPLEDGEMAVARKMGVTDKEVDRLCEAVLAALSAGPLLPDELREAVGGAVRSLGAEGTKRGITSTLPLALGRLQPAGEIRRVPVNGRLDQQRYRYVRWLPNPLAGRALPSEEVYAQLAHRYFAWIGPATIAQFQWFSGLGVRAAKAAVAGIGLVPLAPGEDLLMFPEDREAFRAFVPPRAPHYSLVSSIDAISHLRRDVQRLLEPADLERAVPGAKAGALGGLADFPSHAIIDRGRAVGLWEYDTEAQEIAWWPFVAPDKGLNAAVARADAFVREELGDARAFSLDSPKSRTPRVEALRGAARGAAESG